MSDENLIEGTTLLQLPAHVITDMRVLPALRVDTQETLTLSNKTAVLDAVKRHATDPSIFDEHAPFIWVAEISSARKDSFNTRMDPETTLLNFVEDAIAGVTFLDSHVQSEKLGRSFAAVMTEDAVGQSVYAAFYTIPDMSSARNNSNDLIKRIRSGIEKDVSVGFKRGENFMMRCSACGLDMWRNWDCDHFAGQKTQVWDAEAETMRDVLVYATVVDARLAEVSGVYDGSTPQAMIEKAIDFAKRGLLKPETRMLLEANYRMSLPAKQVQVAVIDDMRQENKEGENDMAEETKPATNPSLESLQRACVTMRIVENATDISSVSEGLKLVTAEVTRLRTVEDERNKFFNDEIDLALKAGVRASGDDFKSTHWESILKRCSLEEVRTFKQEWDAKGDAELGGGQRSAGEGDAEPVSETKVEDEKPADNKREVKHTTRAVENLLDI